MFIKNLTVFILTLIVLTSCQTVLSQTKSKNKKSVDKTDGSEFYQTEFLEGDYKQVDVVAYVKVRQITLVDSLGNGDCGNNKGTGYCLYRLKADLKEIFKGKVSQREIEFYTSADADYPKKNLMGERVVFLNWSDNYPDKKKSLGTLENSTRAIEYDVLKNLRSLAGKKS